MKLFYFLALEVTAVRRPKVKDECDRAHLPDIEHGEWFCKYDGIKNDHTHPEEVKHNMLYMLYLIIFINIIYILLYYITIFTGGTPFRNEYSVRFGLQ